MFQVIRNLSLVCVTTLLVGCGDPLLRGVCMETFRAPGGGSDEPWARITLKWNKVNLPGLGSFGVGTGSLPLFATFDGAYKQFGKIRSFQNNTRQPAGMDTAIELNLSTLSEQPPQGGANLLPNGLQTPLGAGAESQFKLALNNPNTPPKDFIYFSMTDTYLMVGVSYQVKGMDNFSSQVPMPMNAFLPLTLSDDEGNSRDVIVPGMYLSPTPGQSGVGVFVDASPVLATDTVQNICHDTSKLIPKL